MSFYSNVTKEDMIILADLAKQQKSRRATQIGRSILEQTHHKILAESFEPKKNYLRQQKLLKNNFLLELKTKHLHYQL